MSAFSAALSERGADIAPVVGAQRAEVLEFGKDPDPAQASNAADLGVLVSEIGADALDVSDHAALQAGADQVLRDLRQQVLLGFTTDAASPAAWHRIEVSLRDREDGGERGDPLPRLRYRTRYFGSPPALWGDPPAPAESPTPGRRGRPRSSSI